MSGQIKQMDPSLIGTNQVLALSVNRGDVARCMGVIRQYGLLTPPVVGSLLDGTQQVLSGECELQALRELGIREAEAVAIPIAEKTEADTLSLLLSSWKGHPPALSEGMLVRQLHQTGRYSQTQLANLLGRSLSWVSKRLSLATKLHPAVQELVIQRHLCPHSAQEIARLPEDLQHTFAMHVIRDCLPKSAVEVLSGAYNASGCPGPLKTQILEQPRHALEKILAMKHEKGTRAGVSIRKEPAGVHTLRNNMVLMLGCIRDAEAQLANLDDTGKTVLREMMDTCKVAIHRFTALLDTILSPGKPAGREGTGYVY